jgi:hypothetical protein
MNRIGIGLLALLFSGLAQSQSVVYSSGSPNQSSLWYGDTANPPATWAATEFTLGSAATIDQVSFWGGYTQLNAASASDKFTLGIYSDSGGSVGSLVATVSLGNAGETATKSYIQSSPEYAYNASFASIALGSGSYFIALQRTAGTGSGIWGWETANATANSLEAYQNAAGAWAYNPGVNLAFSLGSALSPASEASTLFLCLLGSLVLWPLARRYRRHQTSN